MTKVPVFEELPQDFFISNVDTFATFQGGNVPSTCFGHIDLSDPNCRVCGINSLCSAKKSSVTKKQLKFGDREYIDSMDIALTYEDLLKKLNSTNKHELSDLISWYHDYSRSIDMEFTEAAIARACDELGMYIDTIDGIDYLLK